ncbi:class I SAM-dependent methyltransferase [Nocardioides guangzhouensis]|uniref:Class I SAM-dependent methyltransferase n=1 Tax=Nocardioides guangzhouensis TaxID=2497878 RepID=A0A4V1Y025_9ACTN|nr:class I SAM-dependent methyltransferase [Nocardioides guangzhouensis]
MRDAYDLVADAYAAHFPSTEPEQPVDVAMIDHFVGLLGETPDVLDGGCGAGRMAGLLTDRGCRVQGVDLSPGMVRAARHAHPDIPIGVASLTALPFGDATFDGLLYWYSTIHVPDRKLPTVSREARRVLRPDGHLLVAFQTGHGPREVGEGYRRLGYDVTMVRHHRQPDDLSARFTADGFTEVARLDRAPVAGVERDDQAVLVLRRT